MGESLARFIDHTLLAADATAADVLSTALAVAGPAEAGSVTTHGAEVLFLEPASEPGGRITARAGPGFAGRIVDSIDLRWVDRAGAGDPRGKEPFE